MPRAFFSTNRRLRPVAWLACWLLLGGLPAAHAGGGRPGASPQDTIVVRLPNQATLTLTVRDPAQLRELKHYHLDSLTSRLAGYITQAETAANASAADQVTVQFFPDKDQPGQHLPEQIRITTRKKAAHTTRTEVMLNKAFTFMMSLDENGEPTCDVKLKGKSLSQGQQDSVRRHELEHRETTTLVCDLGLNALVNQRAATTDQPAPVDLRTEGSRYVNIGFDNRLRLGGKRSPLEALIGLQFAFNNYMLTGNNRWVDADGRTSVVPEIGGRQFQKTKLASSSINMPLLLQLQLHDSHYQPTLLLGAGGFVGYRLKSWTKLKYTTDGTTYKDKDVGGYNMENFLYGLQATLGYGDCVLFAKYHLNDLFRAGAGPNTQVVSFGVRLFGN